MKLKKSLLTATVVALGLSVVVFDAEAKRLGGGKSVGRQSSNVTQREAAPQAPAGNAATNQAAPAQNVAPSQAAPARPATPAAAPAAQAGRSKWMAPLAGIAAGLGLAALASYFGFGEGLASLMLVMLLALAAVVVVRMVMARRAASARSAQGPFAYSSVGQEAAVRGWSPPADGGRAEPRAVAASAAPVVAESSGFRVPADFDAEGFVRNAKSQFVRMQAAFDSADLQQLREFTTAGMFDQLKADIEERRGTANRTDVVTLEAELLGIESDSREHTASVRFHGMTREAEGAAAEPFDEVWNLTKPADGSSGWVLAGVQQLT